MSDMKQTDMFNWENHAENSVGRSSGESTRFWYVYDPVSDKMLVIDSEGCHRWVYHNLSNGMPLLFNTVREAQRIAGKFSAKYRVYPFRI